MNSTDFTVWMYRNNLSNSAASRTLGLTRNAVRAYLDPQRAKPLPRYVALACAAIDAELEPVGGEDDDGGW